ncbi:MAG: catalase [Clostridia bacterium]|nr:catalase [Clostridia bacterium]
MHFFGHLKTVLSHKWQVFLLCKKVGIIRQGLTHDLSKFSPTEFLPGAKYYQGGKRSPNEQERLLFGYSAAWLHHKGRNRHHFEYWCDYNPKERKMMPVKMPVKYLAELLCDRIAASKIYQGKNYTDAFPLEYFLRGKPTRTIHPETSDFIEKMLTLLANEGEDKMISELKGLLKCNKGLESNY